MTPQILIHILLLIFVYLVTLMLSSAQGQSQLYYNVATFAGTAGAAAAAAAADSSQQQHDKPTAKSSTPTTLIVVISVVGAVLFVLFLVFIGSVVLLVCSICSTKRRKKTKQQAQQQKQQRAHHGSNMHNNKLDEELICSDGLTPPNPTSPLSSKEESKQKSTLLQSPITSTSYYQAPEPEPEPEFEIVDLTLISETTAREREAAIAAIDSSSPVTTAAEFLLHKKDFKMKRPFVGAASSSEDATKTKIYKSQVKSNEVRIIDKLGRGGFGSVFIAEYDNELVAIKKFDLEELDENDLVTLVDQFENEVKLLATLSHPNILGFRGAILDMPDISILTEYLEQGSLYELVYKRSYRVPIRNSNSNIRNKSSKTVMRGQDTSNNNKQPRAEDGLTWDQKLTILHDIAQGLLYLHEKKVLHRDLKSQNILLTCASSKTNRSSSVPIQSMVLHAKIGDFGLSKIRYTKANYNTKNVGTSLWMAPEVMSGKYGNEVDVYSFGMIMYELLYERVPYHDYIAKNKKFNVSNEIARDHTFRPTVHPKIWYNPQPPPKMQEAYIKLMTQCWKQDPTERPTTLSVLAELDKIKQILYDASNLSY